MLFNSLHFVLFFLCVFILFYLYSSINYRLVLLLFSSYYFYIIWNFKYFILIFLVTLIAYIFAFIINNEKVFFKRKIKLYLSLIILFSFLIYFKYFNFFIENFNYLFNLFNFDFNFKYLDLILPVGISFYIFQTAGYLIDIFNNKINPEKSFLVFALYVSFFPQLVAGPIERASNLFPQFKKKIKFDLKNIFIGLKLIVFGFFLKLVIADRISIAVDNIYNNVQSYSGLSLIISTYLFSFQIFADFAGYSFIAIGLARILGIYLMENFKRPYLSKSISEFWRRWHISLSSWFKDYIYFPLGGSRVKIKRWMFNISIVFLISGLWHGASWTFIIWGILHATYIIIEHFLTKNFFYKIFIKTPIYLKVLITFHLVLFGWIFFRANSLNDAFYIILHFFDFSKIF